MLEVSWAAGFCLEPPAGTPALEAPPLEG